MARPMSKKIQAEYELIAFEASASIDVRGFRLLRFTSPWHLHPEFERTLAVSGAGMRFVGDKALRNALPCSHTWVG